MSIMFWECDPGVEFVKQSGARSVLLSVFRPYPGTPLWDHPKNFGCRLTRGPDFEAHFETEALTRREIFECARHAGDELRRAGIAEVQYLRWDVYEWEEAADEAPPE